MANIVHPLTVGILLLAAPVLTEFFLYPSGLSSTNTLSLGCVRALGSAIECDPYLQAIATRDWYGSFGDNVLQASVCSVACGHSLSSYHDKVLRACQNDPAPWQGIPAQWLGDVVWAKYNQSCQTDDFTGKFCTDYIAGIMSTSRNDSNITSLPTFQLCSPCVVSLLAATQATAYSNYDESYVRTWAAVQQTCNVSYPTAVQPQVLNQTIAPGITNSTPNTTCLSGSSYLVKDNENCQSIATSQKVATGPLKILNDIFPDCSNLQRGQILCLPRPCLIYSVQPNDTCVSIASAYNRSSSLLRSYNININSDCSNIEAGTNICVGPDTPIYTPTPIAGVTATQTLTYATTTAIPSGNTPSGPAQTCGKYYQVVPGDICQKISLTNGITVTMFESLNPSIMGDCTNLVPGSFYCVQPVLGGSNTTSSDETTSVTATLTSSFFAPPPGPTPSGSPPNCATWHLVVTADTCELLATTYGIAFDQLRQLNPQLDANCSNLWLGDASVYPSLPMFLY